jgi:recombination protein RecT
MATDLTIIDPKTIGSELQKYKGQMEAALPRHMTADRMARIALTSLRVNPKLLNCTRESFYGSLMAASQLGLEPGINGQCYLIPYKQTCTLIPGWRGYMELLNRTERAIAWTDAVYDGDEFDYEKGDKPFIHHKTGKWAGIEAAMTYVYSVGRIKNMEIPILDVWDINKIWAHRDKNNKCYDKSDHYSFKHPEMYARKIPLLQVLKYLPSSIELANASALDVTGTEGRQALTIDMALTGALENGADTGVPDANDPREQELESLFEKLGKNPTERKMLRDSYVPQGKIDELISSLKGRLAPEVRTQQTQEQKPTETVTQTTTAAQDTQPTSTRRRGRPSREEVAARQAAEQQQASTQPVTQASVQAETPAQTEQPAQESKPVQASDSGQFSFV